MVSVNVMFTSRSCEYYRQIDGVGMGSPVGPLLANIFLSQYNSEIALHSYLYFRYVDDIVRTMIRGSENPLLQFVNTLHSNLRITLEKEIAEHGLPFLDLELKKVGNSIVSNWYRKENDTGVVLNSHATVPKIKLSGNISVFVHRIFNSTSNWVNFHSSWENAAKILSDNQYPSGFIASIFEATLSKIIGGKGSVDRDRRNAGKLLGPSLSLNLQYKGNPSADFARKLKNTFAVVKCVLYYDKAEDHSF